MAINVLAGQFPVSLCIRDNLAHIETSLDSAEPDDLVVVPEGALSGYSDNIGFLDSVDPAELQRAMGYLQSEVLLRRVHLIYGSCILESGLWYHAAICYSYANSGFTYRTAQQCLSHQEERRSRRFTQTSCVLSGEESIWMRCRIGTYRSRDMMSSH
jgi:predicted amidohydrolase